MTRLSRNEGTGFRHSRISTRQRPPIVPELTWQQFNAVWRSLTHTQRAELHLFATDHNVTLWKSVEAWWSMYGATEVSPQSGPRMTPQAKCRSGWEE